VRLLATLPTQISHSPFTMIPSAGGLSTAAINTFHLSPNKVIIFVFHLTRSLTRIPSHTSIGSSPTSPIGALPGHTKSTIAAPSPSGLLSRNGCGCNRSFSAYLSTICSANIARRSNLEQNVQSEATRPDDQPARKARIPIIVQFTIGRVSVGTRYSTTGVK
jgi:hypothetical protein